MQFWHWFVIPTAIGAILIVRDGVEWLRGRVDVFDPVGLIGLFGLHYFLLAPFLHVWWDFWWEYRFNPLEWRPWLGRMAILNLIGLIGYRFAMQMAHNHAPLPRKSWQLNWKRFSVVMPIALVGSALLQSWIYLDQGGLFGYIQTYEESLGTWSKAFQGRGWQFVLAESFPILSALTYILLLRKHPLLRKNVAVVLFLGFQLVMELFFGGLRGSRSNVIFGLFWTIGLVHFYVRRITRKQIIAGALVVFAYMNVYYFYKHGGVEALMSAANRSSYKAIAGIKGDRDEKKFILLHDFGRADIQALALYLIATGDDYRYGLGRSYLGGFASIVPRAIWPDRPQTVRKERTELLYGARSPSSRNVGAQVMWMFGAPGEAMLNFGVLAAPFPFLVWGFAVGWVALLFRRLPRDDTRALLLPFLVGLSLIMFIGESHIIVFWIVKDGLVPSVVLFLCSDRKLAPARV